MALADYLEALGVTHVAMESTGVLWKPVWNILESRRFTLLLKRATPFVPFPLNQHRRRAMRSGAIQKNLREALLDAF